MKHGMEFGGYLLLSALINLKMFFQEAVFLCFGCLYTLPKPNNNWSWLGSAFDANGPFSR